MIAYFDTLTNFQQAIFVCILSVLPLFLGGWMCGTLDIFRKKKFI
jgi:hypothetical protein